MVNGRNGVVQRRFSRASKRLDKQQRAIGRSPRLRQRDGNGRMMRISEAERRIIARRRQQSRGIRAVRVGRPRAI